MTYYTTLKTELDEIILVANEHELTGLYFYDQAHLPVIQTDWVQKPRHAVLQQAREQLKEYLDAKRTSFSIPLKISGTPFQERVWRQIALIPFAETITYSELASRAGAPDAVRAVGAATGRNRIGVIIPCHRVVGKDGSLTGYAGGLPRKRHLLELERGIANPQLPYANASSHR
jgi:methylated-DNA-[protein]-cysteine S-methyltransferase